MQGDSRPKTHRQSMLLTALEQDPSLLLLVSDHHFDMIRSVLEEKSGLQSVILKKDDLQQ